MERKTKIIATLGPSSGTEEVFSKIASYVDMVRLNFSWGTHEEMKNLIEMVRKVSDEQGRKILIIQDLSGPRKQEANGHHMDTGAQGVITEKDLIDLEFGVKNSVDYVAMSYVGNSSDVIALRDHMEKFGNKIPVIAKIERKEAVDNIEDIINVSDAIMIARGDLGKALPIEEIPLVEKNILSLCINKNKFVIVATEMLLSMVKEDRPTRAEVTDVEFAVTSGASAVMLSEETATGEHPLESVMALDKIVRYSDEHPLD
ncbi:MAG: pyruvate kinase [Candidatus Paceibacterota bacterium]|jgi:pyruvate kinase